MKEKVKSENYKGYRISVYENKNSTTGKFHVYGRLFLGQVNSPDDALNLPTYHEFGDDPDNLIEKVKEKMDIEFQG